jgi:hypothetical protein
LKWDLKEGYVMPVLDLFIECMTSPIMKKKLGNRSRKLEENLSYIENFVSSGISLKDKRIAEIMFVREENAGEIQTNWGNYFDTFEPVETEDRFERRELDLNEEEEDSVNCKRMRWKPGSILADVW